MAKKNGKPGKFDNLTRAELAEAVGRDVRTITNWLQAGCPKKPNGRYCLSDVIQWRLDEQMVSTSPGEKSEALERYRKARAEMVEIELQKLKGDLVERSNVIDAWGCRYKMFRDAALSIPERLPPMLVGLKQAEIESVLRDEVESILLGFARDGKFTPREVIDKYNASD